MPLVLILVAVGLLTIGLPRTAVGQSWGSGSDTGRPGDAPSGHAEPPRPAGADEPAEADGTSSDTDADADTDAESDRDRSRRAESADRDAVTGSPRNYDQPAAPDRFRIGLQSYGRVGVSIMPDGEPPLPLNTVRFGPRWQQQSYQELTVTAEENPDHPDKLPLDWRFQFTLAFDEQLFHYTGEWDIGAAIRNLYIEARPEEGLDVWIGSRMYRGQDIYLFDTWPLWDLNTVGAGFGINFSGERWQQPDDLRLQAHVGLNLLRNDPFILDETAVPDPVKPGAIIQTYLQRQKTIASVTASYRIGETMEARLHTELHVLPDGDWINPATGTFDELPGEVGFLIGGRFSLRLPLVDGAPDSSLHAFVRAAFGPAAYDELGIPDDRDDDRDLGNALEFTAAASAALEFGPLGMHVAMALRRFADADRQNDFDLDDRWEVSLALRPELYVGELFRVGLEVSWQRFVSDGIFAASGQREAADELQLTVFGAISAGNDNLWQRPQLRVFVTMALLNGAAVEWLDTFVVFERPNATEWIFGVQAEWWFG